MRLFGLNMLELTALLVSCAAATIAAGSAHADGAVAASNVAAARQLGEEGIEAYRDGHPVAAVEKLERAYALFAVPTLGLWSARALAESGRWVEASERYRETLRLSPDIGDPAAQKQAQFDAQEELESLSPRIPRLTISLIASTSAQVEVQLDGETLPAAAIGIARGIDPGAHRLVAIGHDQRVETQVHVEEGESKTVPVEFRSPRWSAAEPEPRREAAPGVEGVWEHDGFRLTLGLALFGLLGAGLVLLLNRRRAVVSGAAPSQSVGLAAKASSPALRLSAARFDSLVPAELAEARPAIAGLLATFFRAAIPISRGVVELCDLRLDDASSYDYFALLIPPSDTRDQLLQTRHFVEFATPLELELAKLPRGRRKVVLAIAGAMELGRGVRKKILEYRSSYDALVVPLYIGEIQAAHRANTLRELFEDRISALHPSEDLYADQARPDPSRLVGMYGQVQAVVAALQREQAVVVVDGLPGSGKTSLVARASYDLDEPLTHVYCESIHPRSLDELARQINQRLQIDAAEAERPSMTDAFVALSAALQQRESRPILVLEDADWLMRPLQEAENASELHCQFWRGLHQHGVMMGLRVVVIAARGFALCQKQLGDEDNPLAKLVTRCSVPQLDRVTAARLISEPGIQMNVRFTPAAVRLIYRETAGNIQLARSICSDIVRRGRSGFSHHHLRRLTVGTADVRRTLRIQASGASVAGERVLPLLFSLERAVLRVVAGERSPAIDTIHRSLPDSDWSAVRRAVDRLAELRIIDASYRVTIPFLRRWLVAYFGTQEDQSERDFSRRISWAGAGIAGTLLMATGYYVLLGNRQIETVSADPAHCAYSVVHPARVTPTLGFKLTVRVSDPCPARAEASSVFLRSVGGTIVRQVGKKFSRDIPVELFQGGADLELSVDPGTSSDFAIELRDASGLLAQIQLGTDWIGTLGTWGKTLAQALVAVPTMIGVLVAFFSDFRSHVARFVGLFSRRRAPL